MIYEVKGHGDSVTIEGSDFMLVALVAVSASRNQAHGFTQLDTKPGEPSREFLIFKDPAAWFEETFHDSFESLLKDALENSPAEMVKVCESALIGGQLERAAFENRAPRSPRARREFRRKFVEQRQNSIEGVCQRYWALGENIQAVYIDRFQKAS
ncbi:hypothetical protein K6U20_11865 [Vibrio fluvialis]|uniref:hypothetical protein n=1 Tax=Vibrio fluvialis TaxID=676 RepID=UPI001EEB73BB|nr:hypothetical protein [Vibrio fluvialis]MCG6405319.1 hypothetical protein [Vibrio fluvialis]